MLRVVFPNFFFPSSLSFFLVLYVLWEPPVGLTGWDLYIKCGSDIWVVTFSKGIWFGLGRNGMGRQGY